MALCGEAVRCVYGILLTVCANYTTVTSCSYHVVLSCLAAGLGCGAWLFAEQA